MKLVFKIEYDGTNYSGWQIQPNGNSIQASIEKAVFDITGSKTILIGAGRTDAGVHSSGMTAHIDLNFDLKIPVEKISYVLNSILPDDIRIIDAVQTESDFHARYSALAREYFYKIHLNPSVFSNRFSTFVKYDLDFGLLQKVSSIFIGEHDFTAFSKNNPDTKSYICKVDLSKWVLTDKHNIVYQIRANRFVYGMVRSLVGAMIEVGRGKLKIEEVLKSLGNADRKLIYTLAQPNGLNLEKIYYPEHLDFFN